MKVSPTVKGRVFYGLLQRKERNLLKWFGGSNRRRNKERRGRKRERKTSRGKKGVLPNSIGEKGKGGAVVSGYATKRAQKIQTRDYGPKTRRGGAVGEKGSGEI